MSSTNPRQRPSRPDVRTFFEEVQRNFARWDARRKAHLARVERAEIEAKMSEVMD